jgi:hypothetical protein
MPNHAHFLLRSGEAGVSKVMRRLLPGYAVYFNKKLPTSRATVSEPLQILICQVDNYLLELVRVYPPESN